MEMLTLTFQAAGGDSRRRRRRNKTATLLLRLLLRLSTATVRQSQFSITLLSFVRFNTFRNTISQTLTTIFNDDDASGAVHQTTLLHALLLLLLPSLKNAKQSNTKFTTTLTASVNFITLDSHIMKTPQILTPIV
jgi:hypothetical protein